MSSPSGFDTAVRGGVMLCVLGGAVWGAAQYPPVRDRALQVWQQWESGTLLHTTNDGVEQARREGGDAPTFATPATQDSPAARFPPTDPPMSLSPQSLAIDETSRPLPRRPLPENMRIAPQAEPSLYAAQQAAFQGDGGASAQNSETGAAQATADLDARLSQLGASYCLLERWGENPPRYRFHCRVSPAAGAEPRRFEATGSDPVRLMQEVADAVEAFRRR